MPEAITNFLLARIADDEANAYKLAASDRRPVLSPSATVNHPERILAECAAKRAIVGYFEMLCEQEKQADVFGYHATGLLVAIRKLAAVYEDHPDYRPEWA